VLYGGWRVWGIQKIDLASQPDLTLHIYNPAQPKHQSEAWCWARKREEKNESETSFIRAAGQGFSSAGSE